MLTPFLPAIAVPSPLASALSVATVAIPEGFNVATPFGRLIVIALGLAVASGAYLFWQAHRRRFRVTTRERRAATGHETVSLAGHGSLGTHATFVQFTTPTCITCPRVAAVLRTIAAEQPGVNHVEIDATQHLDLVSQLDIRTAPTVIVLDASGRPVARASGAIGSDEALAALADVPILDRRAPSPTPVATTQELS